MGVYSNKAVGIDLSHWNGDVDWSRCDADYVILKAGEGKDVDPRLADYVDGAVNKTPAGKKPGIGLYWFLDSSYYTLAGYSLQQVQNGDVPMAKDEQFQAIIRAVQTKTFNFLAMDCERWWLDYSEYFEYINGKRKLEDVRKVPNAWISATYKLITERVQDWLWKYYYPEDRKNKVYTGKWFVDSFSPDMNAWIKKFDLWIAYYSQPNKTVNLSSLQEFKDKYLPPDNVTPPTLSCTDYDIWQCIGQVGSYSFTLPWVNNGKSAVDINISRLERDNFLSSIGVKQEPETPEPPTDPELPPTGNVDLSGVYSKLDQLDAKVTNLNSNLNKVLRLE